MKLELKHLAPYLPYGLKVIHEGHVKEVHGLMNEEIYLDYNGIGTDMSGKELFEVKPLFLPLSTLTEPMEDGSVPIVRLAEIAEIDTSEYFVLINGVRTPEYQFEYDEKNHCFTSASYDKGGFEVFSTPNQLQLFEYLFANHFDVFNLISCQIADAK